MAAARDSTDVPFLPGNALHRSTPLPSAGRFSGLAATGGTAPNRTMMLSGGGGGGGSGGVGHRSAAVLNDDDLCRHCLLHHGKKHLRRDHDHGSV